MRYKLNRSKEVIVLLAHGSPEKYAEKVLLSLKNKLSANFARNSFKLLYAFLQFNKPSLEECFKLILKENDTKKLRRIVILPVFISNGRHTLYDVPKIIKKIMGSYKDLNIKLALPLGSDDLVVKLLHKRYIELGRW